MAKPHSEAHSVPRPEAENNRVEMRIPARAEWVRVVRLATAGVAARLGFSYDDVEDLKLAVAEACNNAILHGNAGRSTPDEGTPDESTPNATAVPFVTVKWTVLPDRLKISVSDEGRITDSGLPIAAQADFSAEAESDEGETGELPEGGMGLLLIQSLMDEVEQESGPHADTTLHMVKYAPPVPIPTARLNAPNASGASAGPSTSSGNSASGHSTPDRHASRAPLSAKVQS